jgi:Protein of unknown function (DUF1194)
MPQPEPKVRRFQRCAVVWISLFLLFAPARAGEAVDLELVLAVDASGSVNDEEFALQLEGIAAGFRDPAVLAAIRSGPQKRIAAMMLVWAEHRAPKGTTGWFVLAGDADAEAFARAVERFPRQQNGGTGMGEGVAEALREIERNAIEGGRQVIDVSGDGPESPPRDDAVLMPQAREAALAAGVTINGLAIANDVPDLLDYFEKSVRTGLDSFAMGAIDYDDFAEAMRRKLVKEIEWRPRLSSSSPAKRESEPSRTGDPTSEAKLGGDEGESRLSSF